MIKNRQSFLIVFLCLLCGLASAENLNVKPGLWEITTTRSNKGTPPIPAEERAEMEKHMAQMSPEMRAKVEAAIKSGQSSMDRPVSRKSCVTKEDLSKPLDFEGGRGDGKCNRTVIKSTSSAEEIHLECSKGTQKSNTTLRIAADNPETWNGTMDGTISDTGGATEMKYKFSAKWLGADCGSVKPSSQK